MNFIINLLGVFFGFGYAVAMILSDFEPGRLLVIMTFVLWGIVSLVDLLKKD